MLVIPLTYGYAILSFRLIRLDRYVNRAATYTLLVALVSSLYLVLSTALAYLFPPVIWQQPTANIVTALLLGVTVGPLYRRLQIRVTRLFYGGWYNYQSVVQQISQTLSDAAGDQELAQTLSQNLQTMMQLECVRLLLLDQCGSMHLTGVACTSCAGQQQVCLSTSSRIYRFFQGQSYPVISTTLHKALDGESLSDAEQQLLACAHDRLWIPLTTPDCLLGLGILGPKRGGGSFDANDLDILQVVARQASIALENSRLIVELKQRAAESEQLHKQILRAREEERKRVARDLHDQIIQSLVGLNYHLSDLRNRPPLEVDTRTAQLQLDVRRTLEDVRRICTDLRPPALDSLGLVAAVRSRLRDLERQDGVQVSLTVEGNEKQPLPEDIALCVFRVLQEALSNVLKHAAARTVRVNLTILPGEIRLSVWDDGRGFRVPRHLGRLLDGHHFGLVGLRERLDAVDGVLKVTSSPGRGTRLQARVLLPPAAGVSDGREALLHG
jgi:signal transduction histidine kinase